MSKSDSKKKVVVTTSKTKPAPTVSKKKSSGSSPLFTGGDELIFGRKHYILMLAGVALIALGLVLMSGGAMPEPGVWDENLIYSTRRTVLAPFIIIVGLVLEIYAIFFKEKDNSVE